MDLQYNDTYGDYSGYELSMFELVLQKIEAFVITPFGILGNILIIIILLQKKNRHFASSVLLASLAVSDIFILVTGLYNFYSSLSTRYTIECKVSLYLAYTSVQLSSWLLVAVAAERVLAVAIPHKVKTLCTVPNALKVVAGLVCVFASINICILVSFDTYMFGNTVDCGAIGPLEYFMLEVYPWMDFCIAFAVPYVFILVSSIIIVVKLRSISSRAGITDNDRVTSVSWSLLAACTAFLVLMGPFGVYQVLYPYPPNGGIEGLLWTVFVTIAQTNAAANFFLYFLGGARFRADTKVLLMRCFRRGQ